MVEVETNGRKKLVTSCNFPVRNSISVNTEADKVKKHRKTIAEMYLGRWPNVPVIQEIAKICGTDDKEKFMDDKTSFADGLQDQVTFEIKAKF